MFPETRDAWLGPPDTASKGWDDFPAGMPFASAVLRLLTDPTLRAQLGRQGQELVEQSGTWRHAARQMLRVMQAH